MADSPLVPLEIVDRLSAICLSLPDAYEEPAWVGVRWRIRKRTFAHVVTRAEDYPGASARAGGVPGPVTTLQFRAPPSEFEVLGRLGYPFFRPGWGSNVVGLVLTENIDWDEVAELLTDSYLVQAPKMLARLVERPAGSG
jgi:hypothetical protein